jgi:hypothetical protein
MIALLFGRSHDDERQFHKGFHDDSLMRYAGANTSYKIGDRAVVLQPMTQRIIVDCVALTGFSLLTFWLASRKLVKSFWKKRHQSNYSRL